MIVFTRIDDRLIHGQVVEGWVNQLKATCIFVADGRVAANPQQRSIMQISVPPELKTVIGSVEDIITELRSSAYDSERAIVLFSNPSDALKAIKLGLDCKTINIGGMHYRPGKRKLLDVLALDDIDREALKEIMASGIKVYLQTVPTDRPMPLEKILMSECRMTDS